MKSAQIISYAVLFSVLSPGIHAASLGKCAVSGPRYWLTSDTVEWSIKIGNGQSCIADLRFHNVAIEGARLAQSPQTGQVALLGSSLTYTANSSYEGKDFFIIAITGAISRSRTKGSSTIRFTVFTTGSASPAHPSQNRATATVTAPSPQSPAPTDSEPRPLDSKSLPPCPTWDWSNGAPPPMRPPFDKSKLYCPPKPFKPPNPPIGCTCP
jgi:hypothetical protein